MVEAEEVAELLVERKVPPNPRLRKLKRLRRHLLPWTVSNLLLFKCFSVLFDLFFSFYSIHPLVLFHSLYNNICSVWWWR